MLRIRSATGVKLTITQQLSQDELIRMRSNDLEIRVIQSRQPVPEEGGQSLSVLSRWSFSLS